MRKMRWRSPAKDTYLHKPPFFFVVHILFHWFYQLMLENKFQSHSKKGQKMYIFNLYAGTDGLVLNSMANTSLKVTWARWFSYLDKLAWLPSQKTIICICGKSMEQLCRYYKMNKNHEGPEIDANVCFCPLCVKILSILTRFWIQNRTQILPK